MENRKASHITAMERCLNSQQLNEEQRETLVAFDLFNELESQCSIGTIRSYLETLHHFALNIGIPFEEMSKKDLQIYVSRESKHYAESTIMTQKVHMKRFFKWLKWREINKHKTDEEKEDIRNMKVPYCVRWKKLVSLTTRRNLKIY